MIKPSRRKFLVKAIASSVVPYVIPGIVRADQKDSFAPSNRLAMGVIGVGDQGVRNLRNFLGQRDVQVVAVCDVNRERRDRACQLINQSNGNQDCQTYQDFRELLARRDIDILLSATGDRWHTLVAMHAAKAGKDIYSEKPVSMTIAEGRALADTIARYGRIFQCGTHRRSMQPFAFAVHAARAGKIGRLKTLRCYTNAIQPSQNLRPQAVPEGLDFDMWLGPVMETPYDPWLIGVGWRFSYRFSGGSLTDWGSHTVDLCQWAHNSDLSGPREFEGWAEFPKDGFWDTPMRYRVTATYDDGVQIVCHDRKTREHWPIEDGQLAVKFEGEEGWVYADDSGLVLAEPASLIRDRSFQRGAWFHDINWQGHHRDFIDSAKTRQPTIAPAETAHRSMTICHVANLCLQLDRKLIWNPETESFENDLQATRSINRAMRSPWRL